MGAQAISRLKVQSSASICTPLAFFAMAPKAAVKPKTSGALMAAIAEKTSMKPKDVKAVVTTLGEIAATEVKTAGKLTIPGVAMLKLKSKPARKATKRMMFGKMTNVPAKSASKTVKCFAAKALKASI